MFLRCRSNNLGFGVAAHHAVNGCDDVCQLVLADATVTIDVVQAECPLQLLLQCPVR